jgi:protein SCO1/2
MSRRALTITLVAFFILLAAGFMSYYYHVTRTLPKHLPVLGQDEGHHVDTFSFYNQDGRLITQKDVTGKVYVAEYFFATCKGICPKMNENMAKVYQVYRGNPDVLILSHTVDPKNDTVAALKAYSQRFNADPKQWMFLTGDKKRLYDLATESYFLSTVDSSKPTDSNINEAFIHSNRFILVDRMGHVRGQYDGLGTAAIDTLISDIHLLLEEKDN